MNSMIRALIFINDTNILLRAVVHHSIPCGENEGGGRGREGENRGEREGEAGGGRGREGENRGEREGEGEGKGGEPEGVRGGREGKMERRGEKKSGVYTFDILYTQAQVTRLLLGGSLDVSTEVQARLEVPHTRVVQ